MKVTDVSDCTTFGASLTKAKLDFAVETQALFLADGTMFTGANAMVRVNPNGELIPLGTMGNRHVPTPYAAIAEMLDRPDDNGVSLASLVNPDTALEFGNGGEFVISSQIKGGGVSIRSPRTGTDRIAANISAYSSYNGKLAIGLLPSAGRVICRNTFAMALAGDVWRMKAKNTANGAKKFEGYVAAVRETIARFQQQAEKWQAMADTRITDKQAEAYFRSVFGNEVAEALAATEAKGPEVLSGEALIADMLAEQEMFSQAKERPGRLISSLLDAYESAPGAEPGTVWGALNAATYHLTHVAGRSEEARTHSLMFGPATRTLERAESLATVMVPALAGR